MLPQGSSFGICKAVLFGDKRAIWKTVEKAAGLDRPTDGHTPRSKPVFPSTPAAWGTPLQPGTSHISAIPS